MFHKRATSRRCPRRRPRKKDGLMLVVIHLSICHLPNPCSVSHITLTSHLYWSNKSFHHELSSQSLFIFLAEWSLSFTSIFVHLKLNLYFCQYSLTSLLKLYYMVGWWVVALGMGVLPIPISQAQAKSQSLDNWEISVSWFYKMKNKHYHWLIGLKL